MPADPIGDHLDRRRVGQHARLQGADVIDAQDRVELRRHEVRRHRMDRRDAERILRRQRGKDGAPVASVVVERPQIGLHARIATRVGTGDRKTALHENG